MVIFIRPAVSFPSVRYGYCGGYGEQEIRARFEILAVTVEVAVFGVVTPCSVIRRHKHFEVACLSENGSNTLLKNFITDLQDYKVSHARRQCT
jgi:hypothetical protein